MTNCTNCKAKDTLVLSQIEDDSLIIQTDDGGVVVTDLPDSVLIYKCKACNALNPSTEQITEISDYLFPKDEVTDNKGWPRIKIKRPKITVRSNVTVRGTSVTVKEPLSVKVEAPAITVEGVRFPEIRIGAPKDPTEITYEPTYNVYKQCQVVDGDAEVYIVNEEKHPVAVVVNVGGMSLPKSVVEKHSKRLFGKFKKTKCEEIESYVSLVYVGID